MKPFSTLIAAVAVLTVGSTTAAAGEYYACNDGRLIRVKPGQLEMMAKAEPCLAVYVANTNMTVTASQQANRPERGIAGKCRTTPPSSGPAIGTRCKRGARPQPKPVAQARPLLRGAASTDDDALQLEQTTEGADAKAKAPSTFPRKVQGRLADARVPSAQPAGTSSSVKAPPVMPEDHDFGTMRILNAKPGL